MGDYDINQENSVKNCKLDNSKTNQERHIYLLKDDSVLKLYITINDHLIYENFRLLKNNLPKKDFTYVDDEGFKEYNFPLPKYEFYHYNIIQFNKYKIPNENNLNSTLIYILNDIYNNNEITSEILNKLNEEYKLRYNECNNIEDIDRIWIEVIQNIINNLEIEIEEEYDYNLFKKSIHFMEDINMKEFISMADVLYKLKLILISSEENKEIFENLKIDINKEKRKRK